jgi:hypothetical protein
MSLVGEKELIDKPRSLPPRTENPAQSRKSSNSDWSMDGAAKESQPFLLQVKYDPASPTADIPRPILSRIELLCAHALPNFGIPN